MRMKTPGKKLKQPKITCIPPQAAAWKRCTMGEVDLEILVAQGCLQPHKEMLWSSCLGQAFPAEGFDEQVLFKSFYERGLALPASDFIRELLDFYRLEIHHLTPNGISQIANFV